MTTTGLVLSVVIVLAGTVWMLWPLFRPSANIPTDEILLQKQREHLLVHYEQVLRSLRDLDEDYSTGKVHPEIYETSREEWMRSGMELRKALDDMPMPHIADSEQMNNEELDEAIEQEIAKYLKLKEANG